MQCALKRYCATLMALGMLWYPIAAVNAQSANQTSSPASTTAADFFEPLINNLPNLLNQPTVQNELFGPTQEKIKEVTDMNVGELLKLLGLITITIFQFIIRVIQWLIGLL